MFHSQVKHAILPLQAVRLFFFAFLQMPLPFALFYKCAYMLISLLAFWLCVKCIALAPTAAGIKNTHVFLLLFSHKAING